MAVVGTIFNMFTIGGFLYLVGMTGLFQTGSEEYCRKEFKIMKISSIKVTFIQFFSGFYFNFGN